MTAEVWALLGIGAFQAVQSIMMGLGLFILRDLRDRVLRLETLRMEGK